MPREESSRREEVDRILALLRSVKTRGAVRNRGTAPHPSEPDLSPALQAIAGASWEVRREVALALGESGDEVAVRVLGELAQNDPEWRVREAVAEALSNAGGPQAVALLTNIVKNDPHPTPAERALQGLGDLAQAIWPEQLKRPPGPSARPVRTRGAVRVRGASPSRQVSPEAEAILALLDETRFHHPSPSVREAAEDTLARLDEP